MVLGRRLFGIAILGLLSLGDCIAQGPPTVGLAIGGTIRTASGQGISGVTLSFSNSGPSVTSDANGNYNAIVPNGYSGTATPSLSGYTFNPPNRPYSNVTTNQAGQDYTGTAPVSTWLLAGTVRTSSGQGITGVTIAFSNGGPTVATDGNGNYIATVSAGYSGTATPFLSGYTFSPASRSYSNVNGNQNGQDFTGTPPVSAYAVSGTVRTPSGQGISGVTIAFSNGGPTVSTDGIGNYTATVSAGYSGTATPFLSGYTFSPASRSYSNVNGNQNGQDFTGTPPVSAYAVSGTVRTPSGQGISGVTIAFSNGGPTISTDGIGNYTATVSAGYSGTATPFLSGYTFSPASRSYSNVNGNQNGQDFTGTPPVSAYAVSGTVRTPSGQGISGVTIAFSNGGPTVSTDGIGNYTATVSAGYSGTATPFLSGYTFSPASRSYSNVNGNQSGQDYVGTSSTATVTIGGTIRTPQGQGIGGVVVFFTYGPTVVTDANGRYSAAVVYGYSGGSTPSLEGYSFSPTSRYYSSVVSGLVGEDFSGIQPDQAPFISSLSPSTVIAGSAAFILTVNGSRFTPASVVQWNGGSLPTVFISSSQLTASVPAVLLASPINNVVTVSNSGVNSNNSTVVVTPSEGSGGASGGLAHFAVGSNFTTGVTIINTGGASAQYAIAFFDDNGNSIAVPFSTGLTSRLSGTLPPYGSIYVEAANPDGNLTSGWGQITADNAIVVQSLFRSTINNTRYEAAVASSSGSKAFELPFDATNFAPNIPLYTGVAIANLDPSNTASVACTARDSLGGLISGGVSLPTLRPLGHWAGFQFPALVGKRGTLDCLSTTNVSVTALRFIGTDTFSSLPVIAKPLILGTGSSTGGIAHYAVGSNFTTGITIVNTGGSTAQYSISFFDDNGNPAVLPFTNGSTNRLTGALPPFGSAYVEASNPSGPLTAGWGQVSADSAVVVQSLFRSTLNNTRYEAAVPSSSGSMAFELPFDATNFAPNTALYTGIAIANLDSSNSALISCTARSSFGGSIPGGVSIPTLRPLGHWAGFQFPAIVGQRGTLDCVSTTSVSVTALRFIGTDTFSSLPVVKK